MNRGHRACAMLLAATVSGCAQDPVTVSTAIRPQTVVLASPQQTACELHVIGVEDHRLDPVTIGMVGGRPVRAPENVQEWLRGELAQLQTRGVRVSFDDEQAPADQLPIPRLDAAVTLDSAWMNAFSTSMSASVVMQFRYGNPTTADQWTLYRGGDTSVNWASGSGEFQSLLDTAFDQILDKVAVDVHAACADKGPAVTARQLG